MEDYSGKVGASCFLLILILIVGGYIPAMSIGGVDLRRIDILSQVRSSQEADMIDFDTNINDFSIPKGEPLKFNEEEFEIDLHEVSAAAAQARELVALLHEETPPQQAEYSKEERESESKNVIDTTRLLSDIKLTPIENYDSTADDNPLHRLYAKLNTPASTIRIALLGDSFVEGDILSCDLREILQSRYGGQGAGFAPIDSPLTRYRRTVKTTSQGWTTFNIMQKRTTPESLSPHYFVSGWVSQPTAGATTRWEGSESRRHLMSWSGAHLLFLSRGGATIETTVNDTEHKTHIVKGQEAVQQIEIKGENISSLSMKIVSGAEDFIGYGAIFDSGSSGGITVDNYSVRSNNGQAMLWTNPAANVQVDHIVGGYDLVILQYGLNIMQKGVNNYTRYSAQVEKMIAFARECFPTAAILVMGVSDRSMKENGTYKAMKEAINLTHYQRQAAQNTHAAFWSTYDAMQAQGGMSNFVTQGWAAKDFTHINLAGGRQVAMALADALIFDNYTSCPPIIRKNYDRVIPLESKVESLKLSIE
ncbi:MAG: hypothetical protein SNG10_05490 [Rikenellaceae bacterium]